MPMMAILTRRAYRLSPVSDQGECRRRSRPRLRRGITVPALRDADSAPASGLHEGNAEGHKGHDGGDQREKGAPCPAEAGRLEKESQHDEKQIDPGEEGTQIFL